MFLSLSLVVWVSVMQTQAGKPGEVKSAYRADLAATIEKAAAAAQAELIAYYKDLHTSPELSLSEKETARKIAAKLEGLGYKVTSGVGGTGVVGVLENGSGPTVMIRGDMDALPVVEETGLPYASKVRVKREDGSEVGVMHACGHDMHQTCLMGTARLLSELRDKWRGKVMIVAQPAEEIGSGARAMIKDGLFERFGRPDYLLALHVSANHPAGTVAYTSGWALANVDSVDVTIYGRGGHGSRPHETIDPIVMAAHVITALQTIVTRRINAQDAAVITVGSVHAGSKHNIIPDTAKLQITVRSYTEGVRQTLLAGIKQVTVNTCRALGAEKDPDVVLRESEFTPATYNDPALSEAGAEIIRKTIGAERVTLTEPVMAAEDFSEYARALKVPSFLFWLGSVPKDRYEASRREGGDPLPSLHSSKFHPDPEPTAATGVRCMTSLALSLLGSP